MDEQPKIASKTNKILKLLLKIAVSIACLWYVSGKIEFDEAWTAIRSANWAWLFLALVAFVLSKIISSVRLGIYFKNIGLHLSFGQNLRLYWLGMFYNLFLPGSISGDAYKVILLKKRYDTSYKKGSAAVLLDRFSGLLGLGLVLGIYSLLVIDRLAYAALITGGSLLAIIIAYFIVRRWMKEFIPDFFLTLLLGLLVQVAQVLAVYCIMTALRIPAHETGYIFIFLVSSVASVLPLTIGGLGIRELVFLEGAARFGLISEAAVVISLLFYLITLLTSSAGMIYVFKDPLQKNRSSA
jgi:glycosyltransferase 2 family protein